MPTIILPVTLTIAAAAALINFWLGLRVGNVRRAERISVGDGGSERLTRRMRAQLNFAEYVPILVILIGLVELALGTSPVLWGVGATLVVARILHAFGMDGWGFGRIAGTILTLLLLLGLAGWAVAIPYLAPAPTATVTTAS